MDCIDFDLSSSTDAISLYDQLYNIYCKKFVEIERQAEIKNEQERKGGPN